MRGIKRHWPSSARAGNASRPIRGPDMPGFRMVSPVEAKQEEKYQAQLAQEARMRAAIARGERALPTNP